MRIRNYRVQPTNVEILKNMAKKKLISRLLKIIAILLCVFLVLGLLLFFGATPLLKSTIQEKIYTKSDSVYAFNFDDLKIDIFSGNIILTQFELTPDIERFFAENKNLEKNLYRVHLDTFHIKGLRVLPLLWSNEKLSVKSVGFTRPNLKVFAKAKQNDTVQIVKNVSYKDVKKDMVNVVFRYFNALEVKQIRIDDANFDFLKNRADNSNPFSADRITFILNNFYVDKKTFQPEQRAIFADDIEFFIFDYELKLNDDIHALKAKNLYVSTAEKKIELSEIKLAPKEPKKNYIFDNVNIFDVGIDRIVFENSDFKEIYQEKILHLTKAQVQGLNVEIYKQKKSKKIKFNTDTLLEKVDIYPLFSKFIYYIKIDTISLDNGSFKKFKSVKSKIPQTSIGDFNLKILDFFVDSTSALDASRVLYAKNMFLQMYDIKSYAKDALHLITAKYVGASTIKKGVKAKGIAIKPIESVKYQAFFEKKNYNELFFETVNISGFDFPSYSNKNHIVVDTFSVANAAFNINSFPDSVKKKNKKPLEELIQNFADKIVLKYVDLGGNVNYSTTKNEKTTTFSGNYMMNFRGFEFDAKRENITKFISVNDAKLLFFNILFKTTDSLYYFSADTIEYSTFSKKARLTNIKLMPDENSNFERFRRAKKTNIVKVHIPQIVINNTNLSNAMQADSLSLSKIDLNSPTFEVVTLGSPLDKKIANIRKERAIKNIRHASARAEIVVFDNNNIVDSLWYRNFSNKKKAIDTLTDYSCKIIKNLKIKKKEINRADSSILIIKKIEEITLNSLQSISDDKYADYQVDTVVFSALKRIDLLNEVHGRPKINSGELFVMIGRFFPKICSDSLAINNGQVVVKVGNKGNSAKQFGTNFNLLLTNFDFDAELINSKNKLFFSDNFKGNINNSVFNLKDKIHQLKIANLYFCSQDSVISANKISLLPDHVDTNKTMMYCRLGKIKTTGVDFYKLYFDKKLEILDLLFSKLDLHIITSKNKSEKKKTTPYIFLPASLEELLVKKISLKDGKIVFNGNLMTDIDVVLHNFYIDSVTNTTKNLYFIPIDNFEIYLKNIKFQTPDKANKLHVERVAINSATDRISIVKPSFGGIYKSDSAIFANLKDKPVVNFVGDSISILGLDYQVLRFQKMLKFNSIDVNFPSVKVFLPNKEKTTKKTTGKSPKSLADIDLYEKIKGKFNSINANIIRINKLNVELNKNADTIKKQFFDKIDVEFIGLRVDSAATFVAPNLLYCRDIRFIMTDFNKLLAKDMYKFQFGKLLLSTKSKSLSLQDIVFSPTKSPKAIQKNFEYKKVVFDVYGKKLKLSDINFMDLFDKKIRASGIAGSEFDLKIYADKNYEQSPWTKKHLVEIILNVPLNVDIPKLIISDSKAYYEEINKTNQQKAFVRASKVNVRVSRLLNDTAKIKSRDLYTIVMADGFINDSAKFDISVFYNLQSRGNNAKVKGKIGECNANIFNSFTRNGANLELSSGIFHQISFDFKITDTIAVGKLKMEYNDLKAYFISKDTLKRKKLKFVSWLADVLLVKNDNPKYGVYPKIGKIAYIHDRKFGDIAFWLKAVLSGVQSTIAFEPKDARKIRRIMKKKEKREMKEAKRNKRREKRKKK